MKDQNLIHVEGLITESHRNDIFRVDLDNKDMVLSYVLERI